MNADADRRPVAARAHVVAWLVALCASMPAHAAGEPGQGPQMPGTPVQTAQPAQVLPDGGRYQGGMKDGLLEGPGRIEWAPGHAYEGDFHRGRMHGQGRLHTPAGRFEGQFRDGWPGGPGRHEAPGPVRYEGEFANGLYNGRGTLEAPHGRYEGEFRDGLSHGQGSLAMNDGSRYEGQFANDQFDGEGKLVLPGGMRYEGQFRRGVFSGTGRAVYPNGVVVAGEFENYEPKGAMVASYPGGMQFTGALDELRPTGQGALRLPDGKVVKGDFDEGTPSRGEIDYPNGDRYTGELAMYAAHGQGELRRANGEVHRGRFVNGQPHGPGVRTPAGGGAAQRGQWRRGQFVAAGDGASADDEADTPERAARRVQDALYVQNGLLARQMAALRQGDPARQEMYALFVAGDGSQEVFRREVEWVAADFAQRLGTEGRSMVLANSRSAMQRLPLATEASMARALNALAQRMDREQDLLFVFLTSHGSAEHALQIGVPGMRLPQLPAKRLGELLKASGIRKQVVVVSACYSGGFIDALKGPTTWVITAARADRTSFGCADENDFTYFGRALFKESLPRSANLSDAFAQARKHVAEWERELLADAMKEPEASSTPPDSEAAQLDAEAERGGAEQGYSDPQMSVSPAFQREVDAWFAARAAGAAADSSEK